MNDTGFMNRARIYLILAIGVLFPLFYVYNTFSIDSRLISGDQWVWLLNVVLPFERGELGYWEAITYEYSPFSHSHILSLILFLADFEYFGFQLDTDKYVGIAAALGSSMIVGLMLGKSTSQRLFIVAVATVFFMPSVILNHFSWTLLQLYNYTIFFAVMSIYLFVHGFNRRYYEIVFLNILLVSIFVGGIAIAALLAEILLLLCVSFRDRTALPKAAFFGVVLILVNYLLTFVIEGRRAHTSTSLGDFVLYVAANPVDAFLGLCNLFSRVFVSVPVSLDFSWLLGLASLAFIAALLLHFVWTGARREQWASVLLMMTCVIWAFATLKTRVAVLGPEYMLAPRYAIFMHIGAVGAIGYLYTIFSASDLGRKVVEYIVIAFVLVVHLPMAWVMAFEYLPYTQRYLAVREEALRNHLETRDGELDNLIRHCRDGQCDGALQYLRDTKKNVYQ